MQNQDENIRVLELETREIQRQIDLLRKQVPDKANIESSLVDSQIEVCFVTFFLGLDPGMAPQGGCGGVRTPPRKNPKN